MRGERKPPTKCCLIVDDKEFLLDQICHLVKDILPDYHISVSSKPEAAIEQARHISYNLLITDFEMPGLNGLDLIREIRKINPNVKVVLMSANPLAGRIAKERNVPIDAFIDKGIFRLSHLQEILESLQ